MEPQSESCCLACKEGVCQAGVTLGFQIGTFLMKRNKRKGLTEAEFELHSAKTFAYGQAVHAWRSAGKPVDNFYFITDDPTLLTNAHILVNRYLLPPISPAMARIRGIDPEKALIACETNAERST